MSSREPSTLSWLGGADPEASAEAEEEYYPEGQHDVEGFDTGLPAHKALADLEGYWLDIVQPRKQYAIQGNWCGVLRNYALTNQRHKLVLDGSTIYWGISKNFYMEWRDDSTITWFSGSDDKEKFSWKRISGWCSRSQPTRRAETEREKYMDLHRTPLGLKGYRSLCLRVRKARGRQSGRRLLRTQNLPAGGRTLGRLTPLLLGTIPLFTALQSARAGASRKAERRARAGPPAKATTLGRFRVGVLTGARAMPTIGGARLSHIDGLEMTSRKKARTLTEGLCWSRSCAWSGALRTA
mmetsp:Transcript_121299/g.388536  ORF Transcript_121299/g.388536 Transcript_121299/m.388536 type:complete len:296 (+) Transcript_121299:87-974(+)